MMKKREAAEALAERLDGKITRTANGWYHKGDLDLSNLNGITVPKNLEVDGSMYLINTADVKFSHGLIVRKDMHLFQSGITTLPHDAMVHGKIISNLDVSHEPTPTPAQAFAAVVFGGGAMGGDEKSKLAPISRRAALTM